MIASPSLMPGPGQNRKLRGVLQSGPSTVLLRRTASLPLTRKGGA